MRPTTLKRMRISSELLGILIGSGIKEIPVEENRVLITSTMV